MNRLIAIAAGLLLISAPLAAQAAHDDFQDGYVTVNLNMRAAPDIGYPLIMTIPVGTPISVLGCIDEWLWCDVIAYGERGWVAGDYIEYDYGTRRVPMRGYGASIGIPIISFVIGDYWSSHYYQRPFYRERNRWYQHAVSNHHRDNWNRHYYANQRHDRRDDRRHDRRDDRHDDRRDNRRDDRQDNRHQVRDQHLPYQQRGQQHIRADNRGGQRGDQHNRNQQAVRADVLTRRESPRQELNHQNRGNDGNRGNRGDNGNRGNRGDQAGAYAVTLPQAGQRGGRDGRAAPQVGGASHAQPRSQAPSNPGRGHERAAQNEVVQVARGRGRVSSDSNDNDGSREVRRSGNRGDRSQQRR